MFYQSIYDRLREKPSEISSINVARYSPYLRINAVCMIAHRSGNPYWMIVRIVSGIITGGILGGARSEWLKLPLNQQSCGDIWWLK